MATKKPAVDRKQPKIIPIRLDAAFYFERAVQSLDRYHYEKALKYFRRAVELEPENPVNHCNMAGILSELGQYEESNDVLRDVVDRIDPSMTECYFYMANNYANMEDFERAEQALVDYLEHDTAGQFLEECEEMMEYLGFELGRPVEPATIKSREGMYEHDRARLLLEEGKFSEAVRLLETIVRKHDDFIAAKNNLALAYYYMGDVSRSFGAIREVLETEPGNLHALCNLAILHEHIGDRKRLVPLLDQLEKTYPFHHEHVFKLATTLGILGRHDSAYRHFKRLLKLEDLPAEPALLHYAAVAAFHTGRRKEAQALWRQAEKGDPESPIPRYYLSEMERFDERTAAKLSYHYELPFEEHMQELEQQGAFAEKLAKDPFIRSSFLWALKNGDLQTKLQVLQAFGKLADSESEAALRHFLLEPAEDDYLKKVAIFALRSIGVKGELQAVMAGKPTVVPAFQPTANLPIWEEKWQAVIEDAFDTMKTRYDMVQQHDLQTLWVEFLARVYPDVPRIHKTAAWAAALEYLTAKMHRQEISYNEIADRYRVSAATVSKNARTIDEACGLGDKMKAIFNTYGEG